MAGPDRLLLRPAEPADGPALVLLLAQLGYPADEEDVLARLAELAGSSRDLVVVAAGGDGRVVGWLQAHASCRLQGGRVVEIVGLVVADGRRRQGVGRRLVAAAEEWAAGQRAEALVVRSNLRRTARLDFYPALGFGQIKQQAVYRKVLPKPEGRPA